ncbi:MAG: peptide ABC transporter substrate-binding protein [Anaerolineaceae bacterium]|nr:peptide ABC transporter substrate-binding protein [Anaerolineaceae bacterium]
MQNLPSNSSPQPGHVLDVRDLKMHFPGPRKGMLPWQGRASIKAVDGVNLQVPYGKTLGLVGESGSGKSTLGRAVLQLHKPTAGQVLFEDRDLCQLSRKDMRTIRRRAQIIFQDSYASLDPRRSIGYTIGEPLLLSGTTDARARRDRVHELLRLVGLNPAYENRYPHEFSGGQRQRVNIARALATDPIFIVADEPVSALDVSIQAQVINLMRGLQERLNLSYLFISHDLRVVRYISDQVAVMYLGRVVETAPTEVIFRDPQHPYTKALLQSVPKPRWETVGEERKTLKGEIPSPINPPRGCAFASRCPFVMDRCRESRPPLVEIAPEHQAACFLLTDEVN